MKKRIGTILMCLIMVLTLLPASAYASEEQIIVEESSVELADTVSEEQIIVEDANVEPADTVSEEQIIVEDGNMEPIDAVSEEQVIAGDGNVELASTASNITDTVYKIMMAFDKFGATAAADLSRLETNLQIYLRCSGIGVSVAGFAGAGVAILQMSGLIEDPTAKMLNQILAEIGNVQDQLQVINTKLDEISEQLIDISADKEEEKRQQNARNMLTKWTDFNKAYIKNMADLQVKYKGYVNKGVREWWLKEDHSTEGTKYLLYTHLEIESKDTPVLTFSRVDPETFPEKSDSGEVVDKSLSIGIPAECMPETKNFNINTYKGDFLRLYIPAIKNAAEEGKIIVDESSTFYTDWAAMDEDTKNEKAAAYAEDLFNTIMYQISCKMMTEENQFVIDVINAYTGYCDVLVSPQDGLDALINVLFATHAFEKEVKDDVEKYCYGMVAQAGTYGEFALSCASQSSLQTDDDIELLADKWMDTIDKLDAKRSANLTGADNFCYIKNLVLDYKEVKVQSTAKIYWHFAWNGGLCYDKYESTKWKTVDKDGKDYKLPLLKDEYAEVLYHYYLSQKEGDETFVQFLRKNGVNIPENFRWKLVTNFKGNQVLSLSDGLEMTCYALDTPNDGFGDYFTGGKKYRINKGNPSKVDGNCFVIHDQALCNYLDLSSGSIKTNQFWAARALYAEHDKSYHDDEVHAFYKDATVTRKTTQKDDDCTETLTFSEPVRFLELSAPPVSSNANGPGPTALNLFTENFNLGFADVEAASVSVPSGKTLTYNGKKRTGVAAGAHYTISGNTATKAGTYTATLSLKDKYNYVWADGTEADKVIKWKINKAANPLKISSKTATVKYSKVKQKTQTMAVTKVLNFLQKGQGKMAYKLSSATRKGKSYKKYFIVNAQTGRVAARKGLKRGTYRLKVKIKAAGNANYKASAWKTATIIVRVK